MPTFSVIIPTYNRASTLMEAVESVLSQTYSDFELIIVDDRSTDNTQELLGVLTDPRVKMVVNERAQGPSGARNMGLAHAVGDWIAFLDSDDVWMCTKLKAVADAIKSSPRDCVLVYSGFVKYDFEFERVVSEIRPTLGGTVWEEFLYRNCIGTLSTVCIPKSIFDEIGGFDERLNMGEDADVYLRVAALGRVAYLPDLLVRYRVSNADKLSANVDNARCSYRVIYEKYFDVLRLRPRHRHRAAARIFAAAGKQGRILDVLRFLPWTALGLLYDRPSLLETLGGIARYHKRRLFPGS